MAIERVCVEYDKAPYKKSLRFRLPWSPLIKEPIFSVYLGKQSLGGGGDKSHSLCTKSDASKPPFKNSCIILVQEFKRRSLQCQTDTCGCRQLKGLFGVCNWHLQVPSKTDNTLYGSFEAIVDTGTTLLVLPKSIAEK